MALRDGAVDFVGGSAHSALAAFPQWQGVKLLCAQAQGMYWFLVMRADLGAKRGDLSVVKGRSIGAAPWVEMGLRRLLIEAGIDLGARWRARSRRCRARSGPASISASLPPRRWRSARSTASGRTAWAPRWRCDAASAPSCSTCAAATGPKRCFNYTMAAIATTDALIERSPATAAAAVRAITKTHAALKQDVTLATKVGQKLFPPPQAELIAELIRRDLPYYDTTISRDFVAGMNAFARDIGILKGDVPYEQIVAFEGKPIS